MENNYGFVVLDTNEEMEVNGGSIAVALFVAGCVIMVVSAGVNVYNGYQEEKRACKK